MITKKPQIFTKNSMLMQLENSPYGCLDKNMVTFKNQTKYNWDVST